MELAFWGIFQIRPIMNTLWIDAMFQAIQEELEEQRRRFDKKEQRKKRRFRL